MRPALSLRTLGVLLVASFLVRPSAASAPDLDLVFLIDTTGSMSGEIRETKERVLQIAKSLGDARRGGTVRIGVVAFRDRGDAYVTRVAPLDARPEASFGFLAALTADGGGDGPEDVLSGLQASIRGMPWRSGDEVEREIFLIGDAPPHLDYPDGPESEALIDEARRRRIVIQTIGCRSLPADGVAFFRSLAYATEGRYQHIGRIRADEAEPAGALFRAVVPAPDASDAPASPVRARFQAFRDAEPSTGVLVRLQSAAPLSGAEAASAAGARPTQATAGTEPGAVTASPVACALEIQTPAGIRLERDPILTLRGGHLEVAIGLAPEPGANGGAVPADAAGRAALFVMEPCIAVTTPLRVVLGE